MKIDIHNHFYPDKFLKQLEKEGPTVGLSVEKDEWDRQILVQHGTRVVTLTPPMTDVNQRLEDMDQAGFDTQILTLTAPSVDIFPIEKGETLAGIVNDEIARIYHDHPDHFMGLATLPFIDPDRTIKELERCIDDLKFKGACIGTNIN
ncbi:MAG: amidohydrolase family protein, partial [Desulfatiglandales bacterium]|nr:amidohydrolase family protein [Desulfatiglandales bacterium]